MDTLSLTKWVCGVSICLSVIPIICIVCMPCHGVVVHCFSVWNVCFAHWWYCVCTLQILFSCFHRPSTTATTHAVCKCMIRTCYCFRYNQFYHLPLVCCTCACGALCTCMYNHEMCTIQAMAAVMDPSVFLYALIYRFRLENWFTT